MIIDEPRDGGFANNSNSDVRTCSACSPSLIDGDLARDQRAKRDPYRAAILERARFVVCSRTDTVDGAIRTYRCITIDEEPIFEELSTKVVIGRRNAVVNQRF